MRLLLTTLLVTCLIGLHTDPVAAHQPRLVKNEETVAIEKPEMSQAFYGILRGEEAVYRIEEDQEFNLYVSILVPDLPQSRKDMTVEVFTVDNGQESLIARLDGTEHQWEEFFEPFVADNYAQGPETKKTVPAGTYKMVVSNPDNMGKYVLSVGDDESFTLSEMIKTVRRLPEVKQFFNKSPWTAFFNLIGLIMLLSLLLLTAILYGLYRVRVLNR